MVTTIFRHLNEEEKPAWHMNMNYLQKLQKMSDKYDVKVVCDSMG